VTYPKGSRIQLTSIEELSHFDLHFQLPTTEEDICLKCNTRRMFDIDHEIQIIAMFKDPDENNKETLARYLM
jgi:hypothetical protein